VPKNEIIHQAGHPLPDKLREFLKGYFKEADLQRFERLGGRILISLAPSYVAPRKKDRKSIEVNEQFLEELKNIKDTPDNIRERLNALTVKELVKLCGLLGQPVRSNDNANHIREELMRSIYAEDFWNRISGRERKGS
jgi:hypothetical protein